LPRVISLDRIARNGRKIDPCHIDVVQSAAVDQHQGVGGGKRAESTHIDRGPHAVHAAVQIGQLHAGHLRDDFLDGLSR
jgi:hypothetical protein